MKAPSREVLQPALFEAAFVVLGVVLALAAFALRHAGLPRPPRIGPRLAAILDPHSQRET